MFHYQNQPCLSSQTKLSCFVCHTKYYLWNKEQNFDLNFSILVLDCSSKSLMQWEVNEMSVLRAFAMLTYKLSKMKMHAPSQ